MVRIKLKGADLTRVLKETAIETNLPYDLVEEIVHGYFHANVRELIDNEPDEHIIYRIGKLKKRKWPN